MNENGSRRKPFTQLAPFGWASIVMGAIILSVGYEKAKDFSTVYRIQGVPPAEAYIIMAAGGLLLVAGVVALAMASRKT